MTILINTDNMTEAQMEAEVRRLEAKPLGDALAILAGEFPQNNLSLPDVAGNVGHEPNGSDFFS